MEGNVLTQTYGILGFIVSVCLLPIVLLIEKKNKKTLPRGSYVLFSLMSVVLFGGLNLAFVNIMIFNPMRAGEDIHNSANIFLGGTVLLIAAAKYIQLMLTVRRLRDIQWGTIAAFAIGIPGFGPLFWILFASWPGKGVPSNTASLGTQVN